MNEPVRDHSARDGLSQSLNSRRTKSVSHAHDIVKDARFPTIHQDDGNNTKNPLLKIVTRIGHKARLETLLYQRQSI